MQQNNKHALTSEKPAFRKNYSFLFLNAAFLLFLPLLSIAGESLIDHAPIHRELIGKWFIFWAIGIRLFLAGIKQASSPEYTATKIFHLTSRDSFVVIRELGFANICFGAMGILSVINDHWRLLAAIVGGLFLGLAALQHFLKRPDSQNEVIAMVYDLLVFLGVLIYLLQILPNFANVGNHAFASPRNGVNLHLLAPSFQKLLPHETHCQLSDAPVTMADHPPHRLWPERSAPWQ